MVYKIKFISEEVDGFLREIEIDSDATFLDLSNAILKACHYGDDQMTSFYVCDDEWERHQQITREDMSDESDADEDIYAMASTPLSDFIDDEGQRFQYVFDPFNDRCFYLQVKELIPGHHLKKARTVRQAGEPPVQVEIDDTPIPIPGAAGAGKKAVAEPDDLDDDFYGGSEFESDDLDPDGFEISDGRPY